MHVSFTYELCCACQLNLHAQFVWTLTMSNLYAAGSEARWRCNPRRSPGTDRPQVGAAGIH